MLIRRLAAVLLASWLALGATSADAHGLRRDCCPPPPPIPVVLQVCHPCTGCIYDVAVCIPACCTDAPCVRYERTLIGHGKTVFQWNNGHQVVVRYPNGGGYRVVRS